MTPFNLEKALAGAPVITRDGRKVSQITLFNGDIEFPIEYPVVGYVEGSNDIFTWRKNGEVSLLPGKQLPTDLFMDTIKKTGFINIFHPVVKLEQVPDARDVRGGVYDTEDLAKMSGSHKEGYIATVPVEWEEI